MANPTDTVIDGLDFSSDTQPSSVDLLRNNYRVVQTAETEDAESQILAVFKTNAGKGSGPQKVRIGELAEFRSVLHSCVERGEGVTAEAGYIPAPVMLNQSFHLVKGADGEEDYYQWNSSPGKGSKPAKVPVSQMPAFLALFDERVDATIEKAREAGILDAPEADDEADAIDLGIYGE